MAEEKAHPTSGGGPESPTTARPIDFDDDQQESGVVSTEGAATPTRPPRTSSAQHLTAQQHSSEEEAPQKPPRPMSPNQQAEATLIEAFPDTDPKVVKAVLMASGGQVEPAFNALLGMSDPSFKADETEGAPPAKPPRPTPQSRQMQEDEMMARQLMEHERLVAQKYQQGRSRQHSQPQDPWGSGDENGQSIEDDFAELRENLKQGFNTTQKKFNSWFTDFKKRIDGEGEEDEIGPGPASHQATSTQKPGGPRQNFGPSQNEQLSGIKRMAVERNPVRRSTDQDRYDADPHVLDDNFEELVLKDEAHISKFYSGDTRRTVRQQIFAESSPISPPPKPARPSANPNLFKPEPPQSGPVDEVDAFDRQQQQSKSTPQGKQQQRDLSSETAQSGGTGSTKKKWQPLTAVAPAPEAENDDPFSVGDDDEDEASGGGAGYVAEKSEEQKTDLRAEDSERLKRKASEVGPAGGERKSLQESERSGSVATRDKAAEDILKGEKT